MEGRRGLNGRSVEGKHALGQVDDFFAQREGGEHGALVAEGEEGFGSLVFNFVVEVNRQPTGGVGRGGRFAEVNPGIAANIAQMGQRLGRHARGGRVTRQAGFEIGLRLLLVGREVKIFGPAARSLG